jgi:hypothetical protein
VTFHSDPPGARIVLEVASTSEHVLGYCDRPFRLDLNRFEGQSGFSVSLRKDGYFDMPQRIPTTYFMNRDVWPARGALCLEPCNDWVAFNAWCKRHPCLLLGLACLFWLVVLQEIELRAWRRMRWPSARPPRTATSRT